MQKLRGGGLIEDGSLSLLMTFTKFIKMCFERAQKNQDVSMVLPLPQ